MSNPGERDDAPEVEDVEDVVDPAEIDQADEGETEDEGGEDDEGEGDEAGAGGEAEQPAPVKARSAATIAVQEAKRIAKEAKAEADATRAELTRLQQERQGRTTAEQQAERAARLELMSPDEKTNFLLNEQEQRFSGAFNQLRFEQADTRDQTRFEAVCARKPHFAAIADEVEAELAKMRRNGATAPRETIALYLIGKKADERASKGGKAKQAAKGAGRVQSQRVAASSGRSDVQSGNQRRGGGEAAARRARLENQQI